MEEYELRKTYVDISQMTISLFDFNKVKIRFKSYFV